MALIDYWLCDRCGAKTFYDALYYAEDGLLRRDGRMLPSGTGDAQVLCTECAETHEVMIVPKVAPEDCSDYLNRMVVEHVLGRGDLPEMH